MTSTDTRDEHRKSKEICPSMGTGVLEILPIIWQSERLGCTRWNSS